MAGPIAVDSILKACNQGIEQAHEHYHGMSGGGWLWYAPEYFITTFIALELHKQPGSKRVIVEHSTRGMLADANAIGPGRIHPDIRQSGRVDILLSWADGRPRGVIEVKNRVSSKAQYCSDVLRIKHILSRKAQQSSIQFGVFTFYTVTADSASRTAADSSELRKDRIERNMAELLGDDYSVRIEHHAFGHEDGFAANAMSALIKRRTPAR